MKIFLLKLQLVLSVVTLAACNSSTPSDSDIQAISNRPQQYDRLITIIKLKSPALLVDPSAAAILAQEQQELETKLSALSPQIQVLFRYRMVLNAIAIVAPKELESQFRSLGDVAYIEGDLPFTRPELLAPRQSLTDGKLLPPANANEINSASWIDATRVRRELMVGDRAMDGYGTRVGVIDTGIDYTHAMLGGAGTAEAYTAIDPAQAAPSAFPNAKVVGGIDLVGSNYDTSSPKFDDHIPHPDSNPLDEGGHGTHVAGTIAGHGDGVRSYDGVAPGATLYAIKVFGKAGSTGNAVILAALEYAADPNQDLDPSDRLDVINLSLGGEYGVTHGLYRDAIRNLTRIGTVSVMAAGNSGANPFIVGSPSTADEAISVAASIDNMSHNWTFPTVKFSAANHPDLVVEAVEAIFTKPLAKVEQLSGKLVYLGLADRDLTTEEATAVRGNVALIDRGGTTFAEKITRAAQAGAVGIVIANNREGTPIAMPGSSPVDVPAIMVSQTTGQTLKTMLTSGEETTINFKHNERLERPELIDTIAEFSSAGPRPLDGHIKPEVSAPGYQIWSAQMGGGNATVAHNGTSMASPHVAGVAALLRQKYPTSGVSDIKSRIVNTAKPILDVNLQPYSITRSGVGRVQAFAAATTKVVFPEATLSLGNVSVETQKTLRRSVSVKNLGEDTTLKIEWSQDSGLAFDGPRQVSLAAGSTASLTYDIVITSKPSDAATALRSGFLIFKDDAGHVVGRIPALAVVNRISRIAADKLSVFASSFADADKAVAKLTLKNPAQSAGDVLAFNLFAQDERVVDPNPTTEPPTVCDLQSAGYRLVQETQDNGQTVQLLQIGVKLYAPITNWQLCEIAVLIDGDNDGIADQELLGTYEQTLSSNPADAQKFVSALTDAARLRALRTEWEQQFDPKKVSMLNFSDAIIDRQEFLAFTHSTLAVLTADVRKLAKTPHGELRIKLAVLPYESGSVNRDDYLSRHETHWASLPLAPEDQAFVDLPRHLTLAAGAEHDLVFAAGGRRGSLVLYFPQNARSFSRTRSDEQQQILRANFVH